MAYSTTLPVLAGLSIIGSLAGVGLGRSAIGEINPVYYEPIQSRFYTDLVPNRSFTQSAPDLGGTDYLQAEYAYSAVPACSDCDDYPVAYVPRHERAVEGVEDGWSASVAPKPAVAEAVADRTEPPPANREWVERYTDYRVGTEAPDPSEPEVQVETAALTQDNY